MPLWELLHYKKDTSEEDFYTKLKRASGTFVNATVANRPFNETTPILWYDIGLIAKTDSCDLNVTCRYSDLILKAGLDNTKFWFKYNSISKKNLMAITKKVVSKQLLAKYMME